MLSVIMLNVIMLSVIVLNVVAPFRQFNLMFDRGTLRLLLYSLTKAFQRQSLFNADSVTKKKVLKHWPQDTVQKQVIFQTNYS
jgi:hypothetical protein